MGFLRQTSFKIPWLLVAILAVVSCASVYDGGGRDARKLSPEWWRQQEIRKEGKTLPVIYIIYNSHQLGWIYNNHKKFSDSEFKAYVYGLEITKRCKKVRFISKKSMRGPLQVKYAILYF